MKPEQQVGASRADAERNRAFGAGLVDDPYPTYHRLREEAPVRSGTIEEHFPTVGMGASAVWGPEQITVLSYDGCNDVLRRSETFSSRWYDRTLTAVIGPTIIGMDEPEHRRIRMLLKTAFAKKAMTWWEEDLIRPAVDRELSALLPHGRADLYQQVAARVPVQTITAGLGLPLEDRARFFDWAVGMTAATVPPEERIAACHAVAEYVAPIIASRRRSPRQDLITILATAEISDEDRVGYAGDVQPLSDAEINGFIGLLIIAGAGTTYRAYGNLMFQLLAHPDQLEGVRADRSLVDDAINESLRLEQPISVLGRLARDDTAIQDVAVPKGCAVNAVIGAANHDPSVFPDPERFDIRRTNASRHLSFGFGIHRCLGQHLALSELRILLNRTLDLLEDLEFDPDAEPARQTGLGFRMPTALPVRFRAVRA